MNERIMELAMQAADGMLSYDAEGEFRLNQQEVFKLSELIVKQTIHEMTAQMFYYGIDEANNPSFYKAIDKTKEHFGIEE